MLSKLYLIPNVINETPGGEFFSPETRKAISLLRVFFVEEIKSARRLLRKIDPQFPIDDCIFYSLSEHTLSEETEKNFKEAGNQDIGVISEAGCPCVADPGADVVLLAQQNNREIIPLVGPSSILLALMASGLNGQNFAFNGYLPKERDGRIKKLKELEKRSLAENQTQIFMEAPYRNQNLFEDILQTCDINTLMCVAVSITTPEQMIKTKTMRGWQKEKMDFNKKPAIFLISKPQTHK